MSGNAGNRVLENGCYNMVCNLLNIYGMLIAFYSGPLIAFSYRKVTGTLLHLFLKQPESPRHESRPGAYPGDAFKPSREDGRSTGAQPETD